MKRPLAIMAILFLCSALATFAPAQVFTSLASFEGSNGSEPKGTLIQGADGNFYGTTFSDGGNGDAGSVFKITPQGVLTTLYSFCSQDPPACTDGEIPAAGLAQGVDGNFYGTTEQGGANGGGTLFKITPQGVLTTIYNFCAQSNCADGVYPEAGVVQGNDGNFYGTTAGGWSSHYGTVFQLTPQGTLTTLYKFCSQANCTDGEYPEAALVQGNDGNFYGTTLQGGVGGSGTAFKITPQGSLTTLYSFCAQSGCSDGAYPQAGLVQGTDGNFYGTSEEGGVNGSGTVFRISPQGGAVTAIYSFCAAGSSCSDGGGPYAGLVQAADGNFYGTTAFGGSGRSDGTVFRITSEGALTTLHSFDFDDGANPYVGLVQAMNGAFYGTTMSGGIHQDGTVFRLSVGLNNWPALGEQVDYFGEGKADYTVWRPSNGTFYSTDGASSPKTLIRQWGISTDIPVTGDFDGDRKTDVAVWRPSNGTWYIIESKAGNVLQQPWGMKGDIPLPGDYDGDGRTDFAVWRPSNGTFYVLESTGGVVVKQFGARADIPVPGDYDGDGITDFAVWRPSNGTFYIVYSSTGKVVSKQWGINGDIPVPGDYDGDGKTDYAVWRPSNGTWYVLESSTGNPVTWDWGISGDVPVARDFDGDGKTDCAVWRPSTGTWYVILSSNGQWISLTWGSNKDIPMNEPVGW